jgi:hypothetical protein
MRKQLVSPTIPQALLSYPYLDIDDLCANKFLVKTTLILAQDFLQLQRAFHGANLRVRVRTLIVLPLPRRFQLVYLNRLLLRLGYQRTVSFFPFQGLGFILGDCLLQDVSVPLETVCGLRQLFLRRGAFDYRCQCLLSPQLEHLQIRETVGGLLRKFHIDGETCLGGQCSLLQLQGGFQRCDLRFHGFDVRDGATVEVLVDEDTSLRILRRYLGSMGLWLRSHWLLLNILRGGRLL